MFFFSPHRLVTQVITKHATSSRSLFKQTVWGGEQTPDSQMNSSEADWGASEKTQQSASGYRGGTRGVSQPPFLTSGCFRECEVCVRLSERKHSWTLYVWMTKCGHWWTYWRACQRPLWRSTSMHAWKSHIPFRLLRTSFSCPKLFSSGSCSSSCGDKDHWTTMYIFKVKRAISYHWIGQLEALTQLKYAVHGEKPSVPV